MDRTIEIKDLAGTAALGKVLASAAGPGMRFGFSGELGAGKTELVRGIVRALGGPGDEVASPSFVLECVYELANKPQGILAVRHWDWYRLSSAALPDELSDERASAGTLTLVEWPERCPEWEGLEDLRCTMSIGTGDARRVRLVAKNPALAQSLEKYFSGNA